MTRPQPGRVLVALIALGLSSAGCGGVAERDGSSSNGGSSAASSGGGAGTVSVSGQSFGGSGGAAQSCQGAPAFCYLGCSALRQGYAAVCTDGKWQCPAGSSLLADCPPYPCPNDAWVCCDPATGVTSAATCDASGTEWSCPADLDKMMPIDECVVKPQACRVRSSEDLQGKACSASDAQQCVFGKGCASCNCACFLDVSPPVWSCGCVAC